MQARFLCSRCGETGPKQPFSRMVHDFAVAGGIYIV